MDPYIRVYYPQLLRVLSLNGHTPMQSWPTPMFSIKSFIDLCLMPIFYVSLSGVSSAVIMESQQMAPHRRHAPHHEPHNLALHQSVEGEGDGQHLEKKSVLKKVKEKAKKIKDTITKHGHGHDHREYEDDDEDGGAVADPELQGAPLYEGAAMRGAVAGQGQHQDVGIGLHNQPPPAPRETTCRPSAVETGFTSINKPTTEVDDSAVEPNTTMSLSPWKLEEDPRAPKAKAHHYTPHNSEVNDEEAKRTELGGSQTFDSFSRMKVNDEDEPNRTGLAISGVGLPMRGKAVASKLGCGETTEENTNTNTNSNSSSPLEYGKKIALAVTEKLKPGEEDRALSEVISEALNTRMEDNNEGTNAANSTTAATVKSVADMLRDSVESWLGKGGDQSPPSQQPLGTSEGVE